uniref:Uncharacterized protein n=1 Tax=Rhizophagus irregularis (strain DAOM 181602 / DAOM 197198 / MUCL 43194) TaxID=747089 RepID=U9SFI0_RHIID
MDNFQFTSIYPVIERFSKCLNEYSTYLKEQDIKMSENHNLSIPVRSIDDLISVKVYDRIQFNSNSYNRQKYASLNNKLSTIPCWEVMDVEPFVPSEPSKKYTFIHNLPENMCQKFGIFRYSSGNNAFNACFLWRVDESLNNEEIMNKSYTICNCLKSEMPTYHIQFMRKQFQHKADLILDMPTKYHQARALYQDLTGNSSLATNMTEKQIMLKQLLINGDDKVIVDLRNLNKEHVAVDDRWHGTVVHLSHAISVRDLIAQVTKICPPNTSVPSKQWLRMQFGPNNETVKVSEYYTGRLNIKYMVQARQLRVDHPDFHYASALFRYEREMAVRYREYSNLIFMDDKHRCKVGEPGYPVAAVEQENHVIMHAKIPQLIDELFYCGKVYVDLKDPVFEPSNAARHATELYEIVAKTNKPYLLFLYTDGGPDHQVKFIKTQLALISLFLALDLNYLVAVRTPPGHSWKNPVERIMSILNLGLQCMAEKTPSLKEGLKQNLNPMITLLNDVFEQLQLKDENFKIFEDASELDIDILWNSMLQLDPTLTKDDRNWANIKNNPISNFFNHCCHSHSYFFSIKKCGKDDCEICLPIRSSQDIFNTLDHLPDPVPANNEHYKNFSDVYHMDTSESYCPSIQARKAKLDKYKKKQRRDKQMPWTGNAQRAIHATQIILDCCNYK